MCVHVFSHLDAANWILDHAAWDSWHPPLPEPVGPEPRAPAPPNILREPCEARESGSLFFFPGRYRFLMKSIWIIWFKKMIHMTWGFQIQKSQFRRGMILDILGRLALAAESPMMSRRAYSWLAASCCRASCLPRHPKASQDRMKPEQRDHPLSQLGGKHWHGEIIFDIQGSYGFIWVHVLHVLHVLWFKVPSRVGQQNMVGIRCVWKTRSVWVIQSGR